MTKAFTEGEIMSVDAGLWAARSNGRGSFLCRRMQTSDLKPPVSASFAFNCNNKIRSHGEGLTIRVCYVKPLSQDQYSMFKQACVPAWKAKYGWSPAYAVRCCVFYQRRYYISHHSEFLCWFRQDESVWPWWESNNPFQFSLIHSSESFSLSKSTV